MESRIPKAVQDALTAMGHKLSVRGAMDLYFGGAQGVMIAPTSGMLYGGGDPRRDGVAMGY
ncbi:MAG: gamma-glutamyltransferase, partial [Hyphomicrobiales bacterium]